MGINMPATPKKIKPPQNSICSKYTITNTRYTKPAINEKIPISNENVTIKI